MTVATLNSFTYIKSTFICSTILRLKNHSHPLLQLITLSAFAVCTPVFANDSAGAVAGLDTITVFASPNSEPLLPSINAAKKELQRWPGHVSLVSEADYERRAVLGLSDVLVRQPGVYARSTAGQQSLKLSIRGSGLASPLGTRGVVLLRDGLPLNQSDGTLDPAYADPFNARYMEIYRGANALRYGAATLGGAINIISPTGYSHLGVETHLEGGSNDYLRVQTRVGQVFDNGMDAFASVSRYQTEGSMPQAEQKLTRFYGNLGFMLGERSGGRLHMDYAEMRQEISSPLTRSQLHGNASLNNPAPRWPEHRIKTKPHLRLAYQHSINYGDDDRITLGAYHIDTTFELLGTLVPIEYRARDHGVSVRGEINRTLGGRDNSFTWGFSHAQGSSNSQTYGPFILPGGVFRDFSPQQYEDIKASAETTQLYLENSYALTPSFALIAAAQAVTATREREITALRNPSWPFHQHFKDVNHHKRYNGWNPKLGLLWQVNEHNQLYTNLSRSYEPPSLIEFYNTRGTTAAQKATTWEVGARGGEQIHWEAAVFYSQVKNELLKIPKAGNPSDPMGGNIPRTVHAGLELQLSGELSAEQFSGAVDWGLNYTLNQFRHKNDDTFNNNRLPVIPQHFGSVHALYQHPSGVYLGPDVEFASSAYADQANTLKASGYGIVNFTLGYAHPSSRFTVFLNARNLADKHYAASTEFIAQANTEQAAFNPGLERAVFVGTKVLW
ncbi:MAG: TonB-dependent receptor [Thiopseudomonas sp.]|nr:TonB-dependent receptor [Thiopseudomonas sp.]MCK9465502.1 TonB-dependent receptor [Thiopseudomonas sp.]